MLDGPGLIWIVLAFVLVFCGLVVLMVWMYSSQSAKRRKSPGVKEQDGN
jgi:flagellar basal body-associated protein FliL